ncbi:probable ubiquitin-like-specific protease 2B isoform X4 [Populus alba]|uniref:probable ubiquitin-like-specific protease 2B isoform X4 n=1 Tax=Populus alba TaxID=43335 RepID=UPI00158C639D|nr:probable ubiquitin-like-specific protease 2B isoform X3 [Populus alba]
MKNYFKEEEEEIGELAAGQILVTQECGIPKNETSSLVCVDADAIDCDNAATRVRPRTVGEDLTTEEGNSAAPHLTSLSHEHDPCFPVDDFESKMIFSEHVTRISCHEAPLLGESQLNCGLRDGPPSSAELVDEHMEECSPSSPTPDIADAGVILNDLTPTNSFSYSEMSDIGIVVDYVVYRGKYCTGMVTFSYSGIKINGTTAHGDEGTFSFETGIDEIVSIESQNIQRFETVMIKLHILSKDAVQADNTQGMSGVEELEVVVVEPNWSRKWEEITYLNVKYSALLSVIHDFDSEFEDVIYPKEDSDAVSISKRDVDLLQPETFINDTIIDFYIKYLKNQIPSEEKQRYHFFNSFFFRKLADLDKDPSNVKDGKAAFLRVHKWTRKVDMFGKDYIFIPVNFNLHWSLLVICHPGEIAGVKDEDTEISVKVPCILHMDPIKGTHAGLKNLVQSYLWEEWKERQKGSSEDMSSKFLNLRFVPLELPQQENSFDCGLFLLHYLELFLVEAPVNFSPFRINRFTKFLNGDWFPPAEASLKRTLIQRLISELLQNCSREVSSSGCSSEQQSNFPEINGKESGLELVSDRYSPDGACRVNLSSSGHGQGIEITLLGVSPMRNSHCVNDPGLVLREFFDPEVAAGSLLAHCPSFDQPSSYHHLNGTRSQIEEDDTETGFGADDSWNPGISLQADDNDSSSETSDCASDDSDVGIIENFPAKEDAGICQKEKFDQRKSPLMENVGCLTVSLASASGEMLENSAFGGIWNLRSTEEIDKIHDGSEHVSLASCQGNFSASLQEDPNLVEIVLNQDLEKEKVTRDNMQAIEGIHNLEGIDDTDRIRYDKENGNIATCQEKFSASLQEDHALVENGLHQDLQKTEGIENDMQTIGDDVMMVESDEQQAAKRPRRTS